MTSNSDRQFEPPTLTVMGTFHELTQAGALFPSDDGVNNNTAQPVPTS